MPQPAPRTTHPRRRARRAVRAAAALAPALLAAALLAACGSKQDTLTAASAKPFAVALRGPAAPADAAIFSAIARADFRTVGLEVHPRPTSPTETLLALSSGRVQMAITSEPELLQARDRGQRLVAVGALVQQTLDSLIALPGSRLSGTGALARRTVGTVGLPWQEEELVAMLEHARVPPARVRRVVVGDALVPALVHRHVDATFGGSWAGEGVELHLQGRRPLVVHPEQAGVPAYQALVLVVREEQARTEGETLRAFMLALAQGQREVAADPKTAAGLVRAAEPALSEPFTLESVRALLPAQRPPSGKPFGWQETSSWAAFGTWMHRQGLLEGDPATGGLPPFTNEYLPGQGI